MKECVRHTHTSCLIDACIHARSIIYINNSLWIMLCILGKAFKTFIIEYLSMCSAEQLCLGGGGSGGDLRWHPPKVPPARLCKQSSDDNKHRVPSSSAQVNITLLWVFTQQIAARCSSDARMLMCRKCRLGKQHHACWTHDRRVSLVGDRSRV